MARLTVKLLESLTPVDVGRRLPDGGGMSGKVRSRKDGTVVSFEYRYRKKGGGFRYAVCGVWPDVPLKEIRQRRDALRLKLKEGIDPLEEARLNQLQQEVEQARDIERQQAELARLAAEKAARRTVRTALAQWYETELSRRKDGGKETIRALDKDVIPAIGEVALPDVRRAMLTDILDRIVQRGARVLANRTFADLRQFFNFCVAREWIDANPLATLTKEKVGGKESERERVLNEAEIRELRAKLPAANLQRTTELALWIMLATCCRVGELSQARWEYVDLERGEWRIPAGNSKNAREHVVLLSDFARRQFEVLRVLTGHSEWCYPANHRDGHVCLKSISKQVRDRQRETPMMHRTQATGALRLSGGEWTVHDLRRTGATLMGELGVIGEIIERCLNHLEPSKLKRTYQKHECRGAMQEAWKLLGQRLDLLIRNDVSNVSILNRRGA